MAQDTKHWYKEGDTLWNHRRPESNWHFDPDIDDSEHPGVKVNFVKFRGDWSEELANTEYKETAVQDLSHYLVRIGIQELSNVGLSYHIEGQRATVDASIHPKITKIANSFGLAEPYAQIIYQRPGDMFPLHLDALACVYDTKSVNSWDEVVLNRDRRRLFVALDDWNWGQFMTMGNYNWSNWKAGDVMWFDWYDMPHASANAGFFARPMLKLTGYTTPEFEKLLAGDGKTIEI